MMSQKALMCPHCGVARAGVVFGYEYRSKATLLGLPLVHIVTGPKVDPATGRLRLTAAKGVIAIGNVAFGVVALGGVSLGAVSFGGVAVGLAALGGVSLGLVLALGGLAVGLVAVGGAAVGWYAFGGCAWGTHALGGNAADEKAVEFFRAVFGSLVDHVRRGGR